MDQPLNLFPEPPEDMPPAWLPAGRPKPAGLGPLHRRLLVLLVASVATFALTVWVLVRFESGLGAFAPSPTDVVKAQLEALDRGDLRSAYQMFSENYRKQVPFEAYHALVVTHWRMFRTRELRFGPKQQWGGRAVLDTHLVAEGGDRYVARFTLIRMDGRWWIDDVRWRSESHPDGFISV